MVALRRSLVVPNRCSGMGVDPLLGLLVPVCFLTSFWIDDVVWVVLLVGEARWHPNFVFIIPCQRQAWSPTVPFRVEAPLWVIDDRIPCGQLLIADS